MSREICIPGKLLLALRPPERSARAGYQSGTVRPERRDTVLFFSKGNLRVSNVIFRVVGRGGGSDPFCVQVIGVRHKSSPFLNFKRYYSGQMTLYFLKGSSGYIKIGRTTNFDKRLSEIRRATTDADVSVLAVFHGADDFVIEKERELHFALTAHRFKGEWYHDTLEVREAMADTDRSFNPENYSSQLLSEFR